MDKAVKIPLMALSVLTTQLVVLLGNTTISKSAQYEPISKSYYDRQITIQSLPVMYKQKKSDIPALSDIRNELNKEKQSQERGETCYKVLQSQSSFSRYGHSFYRVVGDNVYLAYYDVPDVCSQRWTLAYVIGVQYQGEDQWIREKYPGYPKFVHYRENGELCEYKKNQPDHSVEKQCFKYKQY